MSKHEQKRNGMWRGWAAMAGAVWLALAAAGCDKPSEGECKRAIHNIRQVLGTAEQSEFASQTDAWVRSCRGSAKKKAVQCAIESQTVDALKACGLITAAEIDELLELDRQLKQMAPTPTAPGAAPVVPTPPAAPPADADAGTGAAAGTGAGTGTGAPTPAAPTGTAPAAPAPAAPTGTPPATP